MTKSYLEKLQSIESNKQPFSKTDTAQNKTGTTPKRVHSPFGF